MGSNWVKGEYFFCKEHFIAATLVEAGLMNCEMGRML